MNKVDREWNERDAKRKLDASVQALAEHRPERAAALAKQAEVQILLARAPKDSNQ